MIVDDDTLAQLTNEADDAAFAVLDGAVRLPTILADIRSKYTDRCHARLIQQDVIEKVRYVLRGTQYDA